MKENLPWFLNFGALAGLCIVGVEIGRRAASVIAGRLPRAPRIVTVCRAAAIMLLVVGLAIRSWVRRTDKVDLRMSHVPVVERCHVNLDPPEIDIAFSDRTADKDQLQRLVMSNPKTRRWVAAQLTDILLLGTGVLATSGTSGVSHPMRTPGAGVLPVAELKGRKHAVLHIRASNRGSPWPAHKHMENVLTWKEFAGLMDEIGKEADPPSGLRLRNYTKSCPWCPTAACCCPTTLTAILVSGR